MLTIARCTNCGKEGGLNFEVKIRKNGKFCERCHKYTEEEDRYIYCGYKCLLDHTTNLSTHKCKDNWKYHGGASINSRTKKADKIGVWCPICLDNKYLPVSRLFGKIEITETDIGRWKVLDEIISIRERILIHKKIKI